MHILYLTSEYPPLPSGGIGTSIRNLGRALVSQGHRVTVLGWGQKAEFEDQGVRVRFIGQSNIPKLGWLLNRQLAQREINRLVRDDGVEIVEAPDWCGLSAGMHLHCPLVIRCHGSDVYFAYLLHDKARFSVRYAERLALKQADGIAAVTRFAANTTARLFGITKPIEVIHNGIDIKHFLPRSTASHGKSALLYVGTIVRKKGVLDLCRAFSFLVEKVPDAHLRLIGQDSSDRQTGSSSTWSLCQALLSPQAREHTEYLGAQPYDKIQHYMQQSKVCVFPSYAETFGLTWVEAMACAKPLIAYDIGWAKEIVEHNKTGVLIQAADINGLTAAMQKLLSDTELCCRFGLAGRQRAEMLFSSYLVAQKTVAWYTRILSIHS